MKRNQLSASCLVCAVLLSLFISTAAVCADGEAELIGWWRMDGPVEGSPRLVKDYSGNGNHGTMGSADTWMAEGGIDFDGGSWGLSGIVFGKNGLDIVAGLTNKVTVSYVVTWDAKPDGINYPYDGRSIIQTEENNLGRLLSSEAPTTSTLHIRDHKGGADLWCWEAFNEYDPRFIFDHVGKGWGDYIRITTTVDFTTGEYKIYVDDKPYATATGKSGSFESLANFTIGRTLDKEMEGKMKDFRLYDGVLSASEIAELVDQDYGLLVRYSFDETAGETAFDSSGNGYDAVFNRADRWEADGVWGGCLSNDHSWGTLYGDVAAEAFDSLDDEFTAAWWAKNTANCDIYGNGGFFKGSNASRETAISSSIYKPTDSSNHYLLTRGGSNDETGYWWWGYDDVYDDGLNEWHHYAFTMDHSTKMLTKYYDGEPFAITNLSNADSSAGIDVFRLFCRSTGDTSGIQYWDCYHGMMDEFNLYDRVLTLQQLHRLSSRDRGFAYHPDPADGEVLPDRQMLLTWTAADEADGHEVYLGDDYDAVAGADLSSEVFAGSFDLGVTEFDPGYLHAGRWYYWRVDEVFGDEVVAGPVWSFIAVKNNIDLYLLIGQSNMCVSADVLAEDNIPDVHIVRFDKRDSRWKLLDGNDVSGIGPAPSFAVGMVEGREDTVVAIVHAAVGGTPQSRWLRGGDLYDAAIDRAKDAGEFGEICGVLWHQGESEAGHFAEASAYGDNLKDMIADMRFDLSRAGVSSADLPFVLGQLGDFNMQTYKDLINAGIQSAADDLVNVEVASPSGLTCWDDNIHFTSDSQRIYGFRYAEKMLEIVGTRMSDADVSGDGSVDWVDLGLVAEGWLEFSDYGDSKDINNDAHIDVYDFVIMGQQWGQ